MDVYQAIATRRSVRAYADRPIPAEAIERIKRAIRSAPSACNNQPWHWVFVTDESLRGRLARAANGQNWIAAAPLVVVACGLPAEAYTRMGGYGNSADIDVAIAFDHLTLAAAAEGLGTCWIGAFDEPAVKKLLGVPADVKVVALTPLGYPADPSANRALDIEARRKKPGQIFSADRFGRSAE